MKCTEKEYKYVRDHKQEFPDWYVGCYGFLTTFGSKFFGGWGRTNKDSSGEVWNTRIPNFLKEHDSYQGIEFICDDYLTFNVPSERCVIYCDPPYADTLKYHVKNFSKKDFENWCIENSTTHSLFISEYNMDDRFTSVWHSKINFSMQHKEIGVYRTEQLYIVKE